MKTVVFVFLFTLTAAAQEVEAPPLVAERDLLVLTVLQQQVEIANLRLQKAMADLKKPGWRVDLVKGQWLYVPDQITEKKEP